MGTSDDLVALASTVLVKLREDSVNLIGVTGLENQARATVAGPVVNVSDGVRCVSGNKRPIVVGWGTRISVSNAVAYPLIRCPILSRIVDDALRVDRAGVCARFKKMWWMALDVCSIALSIIYVPRACPVRRSPCSALNATRADFAEKGKVCVHIVAFKAGINIVVVETSPRSLHTGGDDCPIKSVVVNVSYSLTALRVSFRSMSARPGIRKSVMARDVSSTLHAINSTARWSCAAADDCVVFNKEELVGSIPRIVGPRSIAVYLGGSPIGILPN